MQERTTTGRRGFTLIELLMVMSIIALLAGVLIPTLNNAQAIAHRVFCQKNLQNVGTAMRMYLDQNEDVMPLAAQLPSEHLNDLPPICEVLKPYLGNPENLKCPSDKKRDYFATEGSSYEYNSLLGGWRVSHSFLAQRLGVWKTPVMCDYEPFHGPAGQLGSCNYLFADGHAGDLQ